VRAAHESGAPVKLVASCRIEGGAAEARLAPRSVPAGSLFGRTRDEQNCFVLQPQVGAPIVLRGKGAGRWPTTESVLGDLLELARLRETATARVAEAAR
jgi:homoserine dehydrogenase